MIYVVTVSWRDCWEGGEIPIAASTSLEKAQRHIKFMQSRMRVLELEYNIRLMKAFPGCTPKFFRNFPESRYDELFSFEDEIRSLISKDFPELEPIGDYHLMNSMKPGRDATLDIGIEELKEV